MKRFNRQKLCIALMVMIGWSAAAGCGTETYNQRLAQTEELFKYINKLNENLGGSWSNAGVEIRMPRQFTEIPPPPVKRDENGQLVQDGPDERQPGYFPEGMELPGLIGAWRGTVEADQGGAYHQADAYAYIMSNAYLFAEREQEDALIFKDTAAQAVMDGLNLPLFEPQDWTTESYPETKGFVPQQSASVWIEKTDQPVDETAAELPYEISLHLFQNRDIQVAVLFVYPKDFATRERISERIDLALETIKISSEPPAGRKAPSGPASGKPDGF